MPIRPYRPTQHQPINQPSLNSMLYPKGSKQPVQVWGSVMNVYKAPETTPPVSPTPSITPTSTLTPTPTKTLTPTPTPTDSRACRTYTLQPSVFGLCTTFTWTNCNGTPGTFVFCFGGSSNICAKQGSVVITDGTGTITDIGTCPLPTPTPTATSTTTPTTTPTNTQTPTPSITPTQTITPTNTGTPTQTPTNTSSPTPTPTFVFDSDAMAYFGRVTAAGGTLSNTEKTAVNTLTLSMKADGIWNSMLAIYPMVGASAAACAQNLKSSSFTGTFSAGWTFSSTGALPNGTSAYMDSGLNANSNLTGSNWHLSYYSRTNNAVSSDFDFGAGDTGGQFSSSLLLRRTGNTSAFDSGNPAGTNRISTTITDARGFFIGNITSSSNRKYFRNNTIIASSTASNSNVLANLNLYLAAYNQNGTASFFGSKECAFSSIGTGLSDAQAGNFYTAVQAFNTTLSRQV